MHASDATKNLFSENKPKFIKHAKIWRVFRYGCLTVRFGVSVDQNRNRSVSVRGSLFLTVSDLKTNVAEWYEAGLCDREVAGSTPARGCCVPTPTQRAIPPGSVNE